MTRVPLEGLLDKVGSVYKLVILASRRALELNDGAPPLIETGDKRTAIVALEEILQGKVRLKNDKEKS